MDHSSNPTILTGYDMHYVDYRFCGDCSYIVLSDRAATSILAETLTNGRNETGGILIGNFHNGIWYIYDSIDPGMKAHRDPINFSFDPDYVNHLTKKIGMIYHYPPTILGVWHRHPNSMDTFSSTDMRSIANLVNSAQVGILSMLINVDPQLRMTFYYCNKLGEVMPVYYDIGDEYFPPVFQDLASTQTLCNRITSGRISVKPHQTFPPEKVGGSIANLRAEKARQELPPVEEPVSPPDAEPKETTTFDLSTHTVLDRPTTPYTGTNSIEIGKAVPYTIQCIDNV